MPIGGPQVYIWNVAARCVISYPDTPAPAPDAYPELRGPGGVKRSKSDLDLQLPPGLVDRMTTDVTIGDLDLRAIPPRIHVC